MMSLACIRARTLLGRRCEGLSGAEALRLEEHLASCPSCHRDAQLLDGLRELASEQPSSLPPQVREQAIRGALARAHTQPAARPGFSGWWPALTLAGLAGAAALALVLRAGTSGAPSAGDEIAQAPRAASASRTDRVLSGSVEIDGQLQDAGHALATGATVVARADATVRLGHATVQLRAGTQLRWDQEQRTLQLENGSVVADVDPSAGKRFTVVTPVFSVLVLGTRFEVSLQAVRVERGHVRVTARDGAVLAESLGPGERLVVPPLRAEAEVASAAERSSDGRPRHGRSKPSAPSAGADPSLLLAQARTQLADRQVDEARRSLELALAHAQQRDQRAEAMTLRAECALVSGDLGGAIEAYLRVARAFERHPAGQNALFAAARLEAERGRSAAAATLLERYLARYPRGRFVKEAHARLRDLGAVLDHQP